MVNDNILEILNAIKRENRIYRNYVSKQMIELGYLLYDSVKDSDADEKNAVVNWMVEVMNDNEPYCVIWWYSVLLSIEKSSESVIRTIDYISKHKEDFSPNTLYFLQYQIKGFIFKFQSANDISVRTRLWKLYKDISDMFKKMFTLEPIAYEQRNHNLVLVITGQVVDLEHGPTKTAYDRCSAIQKGLGKQVLLINTAEVLPRAGYVPFYDASYGAYDYEKINDQSQEWNGCIIPFFQCENVMPDIDTLAMLMEYIKKLAPERIISIGGTSIVGDLANCLVPTLTLGLCPSDIDITMTDYQTLSRPINEADILMLKELGFDENHIVNSVFTSGLKEQKEHITKCELGIDGKFLIAVIGGRLDTDVTDEFLKLMEDIITEDIIVGFFGVYDEYDNRMSKFPRLKGKTTYFGMRSDILSLMEVTDLYVNPIRIGGGTSCVEAMCKGVPVVSVDYGDVSVNAGKEFCVKDYEEMGKTINKYINDRDYYKEMSEKAKRRSELLLDTQTEFVRILSEVDKREGINN